MRDAGIPTVPQQPHVVIVGAGFAGLEAARALANQPVRVTVIDRQNHHLFQPLLYQVASAALSPGDIASPIRTILRKARNVRVLLDEVTRVDPDRQRVLLAGDTELAYDYLILAAGSRHFYFGHSEWEPLAPGIKTIEDALEVRRRLLLAFELAEREEDQARRQALLTFVLVGGGPTGVEMAGALAEVAYDTLAHDFRSIDPRQSRIILLEGGPRLLPTFPPDLSEAAARSLRRLGVEIRLNSLVTAVTPGGVRVGDEFIPARVVFWSAGNAASPLGRALGAPTDRMGRVQVEPDLSLPAHPNAFVVGDLCLFTHQDGQPLPGVAPVAIQEGRAAARNILRSVSGKPRQPFRFRSGASPAVIGRAAAVIDLGRVHLTGLIAWLAWLFIHIWFLIGFDNRVVVLWQWAWSFFTYQRGARLITGPVGPGGRAAMALPGEEAPAAPPAEHGQRG